MNARLIPKPTQRELLHQIFLLSIAFLAGHFVVLQNTKRSWSELRHHAYYFHSVLWSAIIAYILAVYVYAATIRINRISDGFLLNSNRIRKQLVNGFGGAVLMELSLAAALFWWKGENIFSGPYFGKLFILILLFIAVLNLAYCIFYAKIAIDNARNNPIEKVIEKEVIRFRYRQPIEKIAEVKCLEIPYIIYLTNKTPQAVDARGDYLNWQQSLADAQLELPADDYFRIHRSFIIHRNVIKHTEPLKNDRLLITPIFEFKHELRTSRRNTAGFRTWFYGSTDLQDVNASQNLLPPA